MMPNKMQLDFMTSQPNVNLIYIYYAVKTIKKKAVTSRL
jgi:hypothetical protein